MKKFVYLNIVLLLLISSISTAQSDYRITQEFKSRHRSFEIAIEYAKTLDELDKIKKEINEFRNEFKGNKELLNRALYPSNFESSFKILDKKIGYTDKKLSEISDLQSKVVKIEGDYQKVSTELQKLSSEVNILRRSNFQLMEELKAFQSGYGGSKESIDSLNNIISELRHGISKRDTLIKEIMDNIFMTAEHKIESLDDAEKKSLKANIHSSSLIDNMIGLIKDNIEFLDASLLNLQDITALKTELNDFEERWNHFGPMLFDIYSNDEENRDKIAEIDSLMLSWESSLNHSAWRAISDVFSNHNIELSEFTNGIEFEKSLISYINTKMSNGSNISGIQKDHDYIIFSKRVWEDIIKVEWMPFLFSNNLFTDQQVFNVDHELNNWRENSGGSQSYFIYGIIILLGIIILVSFLMLNRKKRKSAAEVEDPGFIIKENKSPAESDSDKLYKGNQKED